MAKHRNKFHDKNYIFNLEDITQTHKRWFEGSRRYPTIYYSDLPWIGCHGALEIIRKVYEKVGQPSKVKEAILKAYNQSTLNKTKMIRIREMILQNYAAFQGYHVNDMHRFAVEAKYRQDGISEINGAYRYFCRLGYQELGSPLPTLLPLWVLDAGYPNRRFMFQSQWKTSACVGLAVSMREANDFAAMPILADALEEAGFTHTGLLHHLRTHPTDGFTRANYLLVRLTNNERYFNNLKKRRRNHVQGN